MWIFLKSSLQSFHCGQLICTKYEEEHYINPLISVLIQTKVGGVCWDVPIVDLCPFSLSLLSYLFFLCIFPILPCHHSPLSFLYCLLVPLLSILFLHHCSSFRFFFILISAGSLCCNPGGVSSGQSYSTSQYESGLQQRSQQGEQQGHQPRTLLHTAGWVAVADGTPRRAYQNRSTLLF